MQALYPRLVKWHRYLATQRDPEASGLVTAYHPWEGTDNSPRWDRALARIEVAKPGPYTRLDTSQVGDPSQRPTDWDYDRYLWLVGLLRKYRYDDAQIYRRYPFLIKDVFFSAVLVAANTALLDLAGVAGASDGDRGHLACWLDRGREGLARCFDAESGLCVDYDVRTGEQIRLRTFAGFAPLFARTADAGQRAAQMRLLDSGDFCGNPRLRWRLLPSTSPAEPAFEPHNYWRGPVWPVINWLLWRSLSRSATPAARTSSDATRSARSPRPGSSPSTSSRSPASRSARCSSPGRPPSRWTGRPPVTAAKQARRVSGAGELRALPQPVRRGRRRAGAGSSARRLRAEIRLRRRFAYGGDSPSGRETAAIPTDRTAIPTDRTAIPTGRAGSHRRAGG